MSEEPKEATDDEEIDGEPGQESDDGLPEEVEGGEPEPDGDAENKEDDEGDESWLKEEGDDEPKYTDSDMAKLRRKIKGKVEQKSAEVEQLRAELEELRKRVQPAAADEQPKPSDFADEVDPDAAYHDAMAKWVAAQALSRAEREQAKREQQRRLQEEQERLESAVEGHYKRAEELIKSGAVKEDTYLKAEREFRDAIDEISPGAGDKATDIIIDHLGEGSEYVITAVGASPARRQKLQTLLEQDKSGTRALVWLAELKATIKPKVRRTSKAKKPPKDTRSAATGGGKGGLRVKYEAALDSDDLNTAFKLRQEAKANGIDVSDW